MRVTLLYFDQNHRALGKELDAGQRVLFGQGERADFPVSGENIAAVHFAIENDGSLVWVHRLAESMAPVLLNERPIEKCEINDGDTVVAGNTKVRVQIRGRARNKPAPLLRGAEGSAPAVSLQPTGNIVARSLPTELVMYHDPGGSTPLAAILERLLARLEPLLIANFRVAGRQPPDWLSADGDLLAAAPAEVTDEHSLHFIAPADVPLPKDVASPQDALDSAYAQLVELYDQLRPHAAAVLAFTTATKMEVLKANRFRCGFYCSADGLEMFLTQGSKGLAKALVDNLHAVLIARAGDASWALYANPTLAPTAAEVGLDPEAIAVASDFQQEPVIDV